MGTGDDLLSVSDGDSTGQPSPREIVDQIAAAGLEEMFHPRLGAYRFYSL